MALEAQASRTRLSRARRSSAKARTHGPRSIRSGGPSRPRGRVGGDRTAHRYALCHSVRRAARVGGLGVLPARLLRDTVRPPILLRLLTVKAFSSRGLQRIPRCGPHQLRLVRQHPHPLLLPVTLVAIIAPMVMVNVIAFALWQARGHRRQGSEGRDRTARRDRRDWTDRRDRGNRRGTGGGKERHMRQRPCLGLRLRTSMRSARPRGARTRSVTSADTRRSSGSATPRSVRARRRRIGGAQVIRLDTTRFSPRALPIRYIVMHTTEGTDSRGWLSSSPASDVSITISCARTRSTRSSTRRTPPGRPAGSSVPTTPLYDGTNPNDESIGIELEGHAADAITPGIFTKAVTLIADIRARHPETRSARRPLRALPGDRSDPGRGNFALLQRRNEGGQRHDPDPRGEARPTALVSLNLSSGSPASNGAQRRDGRDLQPSDRRTTRASKQPRRRKLRCSKTW